MATPQERPEAKVAALEPTCVFSNFVGITSVPRPSGHEREAFAYLRGFARALELESFFDTTGNLIVKKPAHPSRRSNPGKGVILQGHVDMVPQADPNVVHDFTKDPIIPHVSDDGQWVKTKGTSLGADDGIGVAAIMSVLQSTDIKHGPLECLFTFSEETTMFGALNLQPGILKGATLLNLDDETEGEICIGSAGSADIFYNALFDQQLGSPAPNHHFVKLSVGSLKGGHSGVDIHLGRANAIQVMAHLMRDLATHPLPLSIVSFSGGNLINAIPRDAVAVVRVEHSSAADLEKVLDHICATVTQEVAKQHVKAGEAPVLTATILTTALPPPETKIVPNDLVQQFCDLIEKCPSGPIEFCPDLPDVVSLSSNLSTLTLADGKLDISMLTRGSHEQKLNATVQKIADHFLPLHKSSTKKIDPMPCAWDPDPTSSLVALCKSTYKSLFSKDLAVMVVHGGLECGIIGRIYPTLQMVSFGPTVQFPHSPDERVFITSVPKFFQFLTALLEQL